MSWRLPSALGAAWSPVWLCGQVRQASTWLGVKSAERACCLRSVRRGNEAGETSPKGSWEASRGSSRANPAGASVTGKDTLRPLPPASHPCSSAKEKPFHPRRLLLSSGLAFTAALRTPLLRKMTSLPLFVGVVYHFCHTMLVPSCSSLLLNKTIFAGRMTDFYF